MIYTVVMMCLISWLALDICQGGFELCIIQSRLTHTAMQPINILSCERMARQRVHAH